MSDFLRQRHEAIGLVLTTPCLAWYQRALRLVSFSNTRGASRGAVFAKAERVKTQRQVGRSAGQMFRDHASFDEARAFHVVRVIRVSPRTLDPHDNLGASMKAVIDGVAEGLAINDRDPRVRYVPDQQSGEPGEHLVRLELYAAAVDVATRAAVAMHQRHTDECLAHLTDPGATCVCRPPAVLEPLVGRLVPNVRRPR